MSHPIAFRRWHAASVLSLTALTLATGCVHSTSSSSNPTIAKDYLLYIGTNVAGEQDNTIFLYRVSPTTGAFTRVSALRGGASPTYLTLAPNRRFLYAVSETQTFKGAAGGGVSAFAVDQKSGDLKLLNQQPSNGASPCYISLDRTNKMVLVANYTGGNVSNYPVNADGQLGTPTTDQQIGRGPHKNQNASHAHCLLPDPTNKFAFAVNLGTDQVYSYRLDPAAGKLTRQPEPAFVAKPGAGPRHLTFHPNGKRAYLINELNSSITALDYDATTGHFKELQTLSALPASYTGENSCADIHVAPNGLFLYASNRGHNSIAVFAIDSNNGTLVPIQDVDTQGKTPRNFTLDPSGRLLLVANQNSNNVVSYRVDPQSGLLTPTGQSTEVPSPMFLQVVPDFTR
ncbi:lactonase family protein [Hymenobacter negativus]|uniref:Lactonase family protein n=1 Tax=Hymenobacter negativus TaxID=2795026 RepID=A0ABS3Q9J6_9BACT|nr:lactonase family protein [Hymenobacter negativus]MBO2007924.1 lactonase family protein [Hymenobacter negativus]